MLKGTFYHGSPVKIDRFDLAHVGKGNDEDGPGFYFTGSLSDALKYAYPTGYVHEVQLRLNKTLPRRGRPETYRNGLRWLLRHAPDLSDTLMNWDENPAVALEKLYDSVVSAETPAEAYLNVWGEAYRGEEATFCRTMAKRGWDGLLVDPATRGGIQHVVVFNPDAIRSVRAIPYLEAKTMLSESSPPGFSGTVAKMKTHMPAAKAFAASALGIPPQWVLPAVMTGAGIVVLN